MVECRATPAIGVMTGSAIRSKTATVVVIRSVTGITIGRRSLIDSVGVASAAGQVGMPPCQREAGVVMVEGRATPAISRVTGTAVPAKLAVVRIPIGMTSVTVLRRTLVNAVSVTRCAGYIVMSSCQWESSVVMVEGDPAPTIGVVTCAAILAKLAVVLVIILVTGIAVRGRPLENSIGVARCAGDVLVPTP